MKLKLDPESVSAQRNHSEQRRQKKSLLRCEMNDKRSRSQSLVSPEEKCVFEKVRLQHETSQVDLGTFICVAF